MISYYSSYTFSAYLFLINFMHSLECTFDLGVESGAISNGQMTASTIYDSSIVAHIGRLNGPQSWSPAVPDVNQWLQLDLGLNNHNNVTGVATQGRGSPLVSQWVKTYKLQFKDGVSFQYYRESGQTTDKVIEGGG